MLLALGTPRAALATCLQTPVGREVPTALILTGGGAKGAYEARALDNRTVTVEVLVASAAVPGLFPAVPVDGALLVDGGLTGRAPVLEALDAAPVARALVVLSYAPDEQSAPATTIRRSLEEAFETTMLHQIHRDVELARLKHPTIDIQILTPSAPR